MPIESPLCFYCGLPVSLAAEGYVAIRCRGEYGVAHLDCQATQDAREARDGYVAYKSVSRKGGTPHARR